MSYGRPLWVLSCVFVFALCVFGARAGAAKPKTPAELLATIDAEISSWQDYQVRGHCEANGKKSEFTLYFKRPNLVRIDTRQGQVAMQPDGSIRGRLGHGLVGWISRGIDKNDKRLKDEEGIPFYESHFEAAFARVHTQIAAGATVDVTEQSDSYCLGVHCGDTCWKYVLDKSTFALTEVSRLRQGKPVECTRYTDFRANIGLKEGRFKF